MDVLCCFRFEKFLFEIEEQNFPLYLCNGCQTKQSECDSYIMCIRFFPIRANMYKKHPFKKRTDVWMQYMYKYREKNYLQKKVE